MWSQVVINYISASDVNFDLFNFQNVKTWWNIFLKWTSFNFSQLSSFSALVFEVFLNFFYPNFCFGRFIVYNGSWSEQWQVPVYSQPVISVFTVRKSNIRAPLCFSSRWSEPSSLPLGFMQKLKDRSTKL